MRKTILSMFLSLVLVVSTCFSAGCSVSQFDAVLNEVGPAISTILQIIALVKGVPADTSIASKVSADVASLESLYNDLEKGVVANQGNVRNQINAEFSILNSDLSTVFAVAQVSDKNTQAKITALVGLVESAVQIAEAAIPQPSPAPVSAVKPLQLDASQLVDSYNKILVAKTGNPAVDAFTVKHKIHNHGKFVRVLSLGFAN